MNEKVSRIAELVKDLEDELHNVDSLSDESRSTLREAIVEIQAALQAHPDKVDSSHAATHGLSDLISDFEASHPNLAAAVSRIINAIGQMGI